ncbi:glycine betaine/proline transport system ATP-binding protein [Dongia mobilis]|uniref:Quaternary amine transport ATP-binding protein n=1 Tax=Dongia mobilis TaxID=578943 RepID=A0A4R6WU48_9PROT|nr:betaine/proline/choline family ABC transporter ATP-binding protein [Dongia mobilis]TDQ80438.1 glycine betaine/proline transport system ATP-binding protein [Dongia mobilis]
MTDVATVKLACRGVWKVFGRGAEAYMAAGPGPEALTPEAMAEAGLMAGVRDVTVEIGEGEIFIVMGLSGSGKSTLLRCMSRLIEPSAGEVLFEGRDLLKASEAELIDIRRHKMGMVFQHFALLPHLTVLENVAFPLAIQKVAKAEREQRAREVIELVGLGGRENAYPRQLSGGQQQRVGIARSLAVKPELWFLDEPFSALDPLIRGEMQDELIRLQKVLRKTMIFVTHDFDEAIKLADRIAIMKDGRVIQIGTPEELVMNPATDYVAAFTRNVQRAKVLTARSIMSPVNGVAAIGQVRATDKIADVAPIVIGAGKPVAVTDDSGAVIGTLAPQAVIDTLIGRDART